MAWIVASVAREQVFGSRAISSDAGSFRLIEEILAGALSRFSPVGVTPRQGDHERHEERRDASFMEIVALLLHRSFDEGLSTCERLVMQGREQNSLDVIAQKTAFSKESKHVSANIRFLQ